MQRLIICGSRAFTDSTRFGRGLAMARSLLSPERLVVVHGACPTGADAFADLWGRDFADNVERFPADWKRFGPSAGPRRNAAMACAGANLCVAFPVGPSPGTWSMIRQATKHRIPVLIVPELARADDALRLGA